jgi:hypothetical protein
MKSLRFLGNEFVLGTLIAILSIFTAFASWQGSIADSKQSEHELLAMQHLNDGNAEYLSANQFIVYDYTMYDGWYTTSDPNLEEYYQGSYSESLQNAIAANSDEPFSDQYYDDMYGPAYAYWDDFDSASATAGQWNERGDNLQLVMLIMAVGLAFAAWASLGKEESNMRLIFSLLAVITLVAGVLAYLGVPTVVA